MVRPHQARRIGLPGACVELEVVDHVAAERGELDAIARFGCRGARLGELSGDPPDLHRGHAAAVGEHDGHLQDHLELVADGVGREHVERLGAVAGLQDERLTRGGTRERVGEAARLSREHERRHDAELVERRFERGVARPVGLLRGRVVAPALRRPVGH